MPSTNANGGNMFFPVVVMGQNFKFSLATSATILWPHRVYYLPLSLVLDLDNANTVVGNLQVEVTELKLSSFI